MGPRALHLLRRYWERLQMVVWAGCYYREPFNGERGVTQVGPLSPTTFNVVVDAVVFHWDSLAAEQAGGGQQQRHKLRGAASGEDNMVKVKRPMAGVGGA